MTEPLDTDGLSRNPKDVAPDCWYYEARNGLEVFFNGDLICVIPWRTVEASVRRKQRAREKRP